MFFILEKEVQASFSLKLRKEENCGKFLLVVGMFRFLNTTLVLNTLSYQTEP
jgi:hypothetical protein